MVLATIIAGIGAGVTYALTGFAKSTGEAFDWLKFGTTVVIGALAGVGIAVLQWDVATGYAYLLSLGIAPVVQNLFIWISGWFKAKKA